MRIRNAAVTVTLGAVLLAGCARENPPQQNFNATQQPALSPALATGPTAAPGTHVAPAPLAPELPASTTVTRRETTVAARPAAADDAPRYVVKKRSKKKSAAIIGGSAAAGAAIGAVAGGGKGAAIGAIAGGGGGLVYDRMTAKKKKPIE